MNATNHRATPPTVQLVGEIDHPDFVEVDAMLRASAQVASAPGAAPELIVVAQSRPGAISNDTVESLRKSAPLSGIVALLGSWCEGETRTGRPWPGVRRLYWYEFPPWWRRQLALRAAGRCPEWARWMEGGGRRAEDGRTDGIVRGRGLIVLSTRVRDTAIALSDALSGAGFATIWQPPGRSFGMIRGAAAGVWDGGQLDEKEERQLATFCKDMARGAAPVIALLDFPRLDRCERARELGAADVVGKPWLNVNLVATIECLISCHNETVDVTLCAA